MSGNVLANHVAESADVRRAVLVCGVIVTQLGTQRDIANPIRHQSMETTTRYEWANRLHDNLASRALTETVAADAPNEAAL
jgi:hypothetical protein